VERDVAMARLRYPELASALERHLRWARDFATAGDVDSAVDAIRDAHATFAELRLADARGMPQLSFVTISSMADRDVRCELQAIAERSAEAADSGGLEADLLDAYESLRARATTLAQANGWATSEELADQLPTSRALRQIERLDVAFGVDSGPPSDRGMSARLSEALVELSAWATGVRLAYETLEDDRRGED
jgi:hypothetical protein